MSIVKKLKKLLTEQDINFEDISIIDKQKVEESWKKQFFKEVDKHTQERFDLHKYPWHIFSFELKNHLTGKSAILAYQNLFFKNYYIYTSEKNEKALFCHHYISLSYEDMARFKSITKEKVDLYVSHHNLKWTFVIPHEDNFGPYFCFN